MSVAGFLISSDHLSFLGFHLEEINKNIYKWKKFEKLPNVSDCNYVFFLDSLTPLVLSSQPKLLSVNMSNNLISEIQPGAFTNMTRLVRLILSKNKITKLDQNSLAGGITKKSKGQPSLITIILLCSGVSSLVELELSNNFLESIPIAALAALDNLKFLNLGSNKIQVKFCLSLPCLPIEICDVTPALCKYFE